jgi:predicted dehydrogenase
VVGMAATPRATRTIGSGPRAGAEIDVAVATHVTGVLEHASGALSTLVMSFDVWAARLPYIEVYGTGGSLSVPDPNGFGGTVQLFSAGSKDWTPVPEAGGYAGAARGYGVCDLASALTSGTAHRASGEIAYHVLDVMETLLAAAGSGSSADVASSCDRPSAVPLGARPDDPASTY